MNGDDSEAWVRMNGDVSEVWIRMNDDVSRETFTPCPAKLHGLCALPAGHADEHESQSYIWEEEITSALQRRLYPGRDRRDRRRQLLYQQP